jgi:hypothetical protein
MLGGALTSAYDAAVTPFFTTETFNSNNESADKTQNKAKNMLVSLLVLTTIFVLLLIVGKILWNSVLIKLFPFVSPVKSVWQVLGLSILLGLIFPGCNCNTPL